jgi:pimeloyl-ACP methyl ester carboxylesterase
VATFLRSLSRVASKTLSYKLAGATLLACVSLSVCGIAQDVKAVTAPSLTVVDPYLMTIPKDNELSASAVVTAAAGGKDAAKGIVADGTTAAIAVYAESTDSKVTFSATNGAKVEAYSPGFLTSASGVGSSSVTVSPTKIGSSYYALALLTSDAKPDPADGVDTVVHATASGSAKMASYSLETLPTPVVLVHGLWGDILSLASTEGYLKASAGFTHYRNLVTAICYSDYLAFDAATDTLPGHGTGCEMTSTQALDQYLSTTLYKYLDENHWVGGRVDAVVHSMGGLVARHYTTVSGYKSIRNRNLGAFRNVVTLDTPETGSALATYLDETAYKGTLKASFLSTPYDLWVAFCGTSSSATVESCFDAGGLPLSYPGQPLDTGAIWSLIPTGKSITSAPSPDIFNTSYGKWYAIASNYKDGDQPASLLRDVLDNFIAATYTSGAPTTSSILGTPDNDVIVTVPSQTWKAVVKQTAEFKDLQHTVAPSQAKALFGSDSNASVVDSAAVNAQVAYWLGLQTSTSPAVERLEAPSPGESNTKSAKFLFIADGRLSILPPQRSVGLGQPVLVPLKITGPKVARVNVIQFDPETHRELRNQRIDSGAGSGDPWSLKEDGGETAVEVIPLEAGTVGFKVQAIFADGGFEQREFELHAVPSQQHLERFDLNKGFHSLALVLEEREEDRQTFLTPVAYYETLKNPVYLNGSDELNLTVDQPEDAPVVRVDAKGLIHALRLGTAVISADFDGVRDSITVDVYDKDKAPAGYRRSPE